MRDGAGPAPLTLTIDPAAAVRNWRTLADRSAAECAAVVKADAYGHGIERIAPALAGAGCHTFFVALVAEGVALRRLAPEATIYVLDGVFAHEVDAARAADLRPVHASRAALAEWPDDAPFALIVDTGMNRLGLTVPEALAYDGPAPALLLTHFACADTPTHPLNARQEADFAAARETFPGVPASMANSAALLTRPGTHLDLTRPGIALYGGRAAEGVAPLEPTVRLAARIIQVREAAPGESVGYGAAETVAQPTRVAIAAAGYADGFLRAGGGSDAKPGAPVAVNGVLTRLLGRVSMDLVAVDVTAIAAERGDVVELIGPNAPLDEVAASAGTIGYELLTGLSRRALRRTGPL